MTDALAGDLFAAKAVEVRVSLSSVRNLPVATGTRVKPDQMIQGSFVGNVKGYQTMRAQGDTYVSTYLIELLEVTLEGQ